MGWGPADILALVVSVLKSGILEAVIRAVEKIFKNASGAEKKEAVIKSLGLEDQPEVIPIVSAAIDGVVDEYNRTGVFVHKGGPVDPGVGVPGSGS